MLPEEGKFMYAGAPYREQWVWPWVVLALVGLPIGVFLIVLTL